MTPAEATVCAAAALGYVVLGRTFFAQVLKAARSIGRATSAAAGKEA